MTGVEPASSAATPAPWPPLMPQRRRELHQQFTLATGLLLQPRPDHRRIHLLLLAAVREDAGNTAYLQAYLENLDRQFDHNHRGSWRRFFTSHAGLNQAVHQQDWRQVWLLGIELLAVHPWDPHVATELAEACHYFCFPSAAALLLDHALAASPDNAELHRRLARTCVALGNFDQARSHWEKVLEQLPHDAEAGRMAYRDPLTSEQAERIAQLETAIAHDPANSELRLSLATALVEANRADAAEKILAEALPIAGHHPQLRERLEDVQLLGARQRLAEAERMTSAPSLIPSLAGEHLATLRESLLRLDLAIYGQRRERYPAESNWTFEVAVRLKRLGNFSEASKLFREIVDPPDLASQAKLEAGECLQRLRNFPKAMEFYWEAAGNLAEAGSPELLKIALYRAATLGMALGDPRGEEALRRLAQLDPDFRDVRERLDKLSRIGQND